MIDPMAVMEDPSILVALEAERDSLKAALSAARAEVERLNSVLHARDEMLMRLLPIEAAIKSKIDTISTGGTAYELLPDGGKDAVLFALRSCLSGLGPDGRAVKL